MAQLYVVRGMTHAYEDFIIWYVGYTEDEEKAWVIASELSVLAEEAELEIDARDLRDLNSEIGLGGWPKVPDVKVRELLRRDPQASRYFGRPQYEVRPAGVPL